MNRDCLILLTGCNGLIGRSLTKLFKNDGYKIESLDKNSLNVCNSREVDEYFRLKKPKVIIHTAIRGGRRTLNDDISVLYDNLLGFENVFSSYKKYAGDGIFVNFTSAAELDRRFDIFDYDDIAQHKTIPIDYYGFSKYLITKRLRFENCKYLNLRLFYTFAETEEDDRFVSTCIKKAKENRNIEIWEDKYFGFFYVVDLYKLIVLNLSRDDLNCKEYNCIYPEMTKLSDVATYITKQIGGGYVNILDRSNLNYTSKPSNIERLVNDGFIKLYGLYSGLDKMIASKS
jgi:nucleoside-diphosphate-sugar epimerase